MSMYMFFIESCLCTCVRVHAFVHVPCFSIENAYGLNMYKGMQIQLRMRVHTYTYIHTYIYIYIHSIHKPKHGTGIGRKQKRKVMRL